MPCGLFGKLPQKRDFIAVNTPREFMVIWEAWLQGGMSASKIELGSRWLKSYLTTPLWRFWLGADICGFPVAGVLMPSMDGVGRHFPLSVFCCGDAADELAAPQDSTGSAWYYTLEEYLLSVLEEGVDYDVVLGGLNQLPLIQRRLAAVADERITERLGSYFCSAASGDDMGDAFGRLEADHLRRRMRGASYWWTTGGEEHAPTVIVAQGMPDPNVMSEMIANRPTVQPKAEPAHVSVIEADTSIATGAVVAAQPELEPEKCLADKEHLGSGAHPEPNHPLEPNQTPEPA